MPTIARLLVCTLVMGTLLRPSVPAEAAGSGYYPNGQIQWEYLYQDGQVREVKWYDEHGRLTARAAFRDGRQSMSEGYRSDGSLEWLTRELGEGRQEITRFAPGRRTEMRYEIAAGKADGASMLFFPGGQPRQSVTFRNGIPHGPARTWYETGQAESDYTYRDGQLDGTYRLYSPEGQISAEYTFENGRLR
jgi:antitoxin component YwqK of YwqJK toxin-antitoxin module